MNDVVLIGHSLGGRIIFGYMEYFNAIALNKLKGIVIIDILPTMVKSTYIY